MSILETVRRICQEAAVTLPGAVIVAPLAVWDGDGKSMGVQIKAPCKMGTQDCEVTAGFVLSPAELQSESSIRFKAALAVSCMARDIQVSIRPIRPRKHVEMVAAIIPAAATDPAIQFTDVLTETPEAIKYSRRIVMPMTDAQAEDITRRSA